MSHWHKLLLVLFLAVGLAGNAIARERGHSGHHGNNHRSSQAKHAFMKSHPCPLQAKPEEPVRDMSLITSFR